MEESFDVPGAIREQIQKRGEEGDLSPLIKSMMDGTYVPSIPDHQVPPHKEPSQEIDRVETLTLYEKLKVERNALVSILISEAWKNSEETRKNFRVKDTSHVYSNSGQFNEEGELKLADIPEQLEDQTTRVIDKAIDQVCESHVAQVQAGATSKTIDAVYGRFARMLGHMREAGLTRYSDSEFIQRGINTAGLVTWGLVRLAPVLAEKAKLKLTTEELINAVRSAYGPMVVQFASMNIEIGPNLIEGLQDRGGFNPDYFSLRKDEVTGTYKIEFDHSVLANLRAVPHPLMVPDKGTPRVLETDPESMTTWCPARYTKLLGPDVIREYFEWSLALAKEHYFSKLSPP